MAAGLEQGERGPFFVSPSGLGSVACGLLCLLRGSSFASGLAAYAEIEGGNVDIVCRPPFSRRVDHLNFVRMSDLIRCKR